MFFILKPERNSFLLSTTVYLDSELHRTLKLQAAESDRTISELVNEAVRVKLAEDAEDLAAFWDRAHLMSRICTLKMS